MTFVKSMFSCIALSAMFNVNLKSIMIEKIDKTQIPALVFKTLQNSMATFLVYKAITAYSVSTVGIITSLTPLVVFVMAAVILREEVTIADILSLLVVLLGVISILQGVKSTE